MNVCGIEAFWNLVWLIPLCSGIGIFLALYWPFGKGPEGSPYVGFDSGEKVNGIAYYRPGDPPGTYNVQPGSELHRQVEAFHQSLLSVDNGWPQHPERPCSPACWRKPDGHRWGE